MPPELVAPFCSSEYCSDGHSTLTNSLSDAAFPKLFKLIDFRGGLLSTILVPFAFHPLSSRV